MKSMGGVKNVRKVFQHHAIVGMELYNSKPCLDKIIRIIEATAGSGWSSASGSKLPMFILRVPVDGWSGT